jgi:hypothetical protein
VNLGDGVNTPADELQATLFGTRSRRVRAAPGFARCCRRTFRDARRRRP